MPNYDDNPGLDNPSLAQPPAVAPAFLTRLLEQINGFDESLFPPNQPTGRGERVIGTCSPFCRKLFAYARYCRREAKQIELDMQFTSRAALTTGTAARLEEMTDTHRILMALFWACNQDEFHLFGEGSTIGVRDNWSIVSTEEQQNPIKRLLQELGGE